MNCPECGRTTVLIDYPIREEYHNGDTEWGIEPDRNDPGWIVAKRGAMPIAAGCNKAIENRRE